MEEATWNDPTVFSKSAWQFIETHVKKRICRASMAAYVLKGRDFKTILYQLPRDSDSRTHISFRQEPFYYFFLSFFFPLIFLILLTFDFQSYSYFLFPVFVLFFYVMSSMLFFSSYPLFSSFSPPFHKVLKPKYLISRLDSITFPKTKPQRFWFPYQKHDKNKEIWSIEKFISKELLCWKLEATSRKALWEEWIR